MRLPNAVLTLLFIVLVAPSAATGAGTLEPGQIFRDCPECPELVVIAAGEYQMGSDENAGDGIPAHQVRLPAPFAMGRFEVTFDQWRNCIDDGGCSHRPSDWGWDWGWSGEHPVVILLFFDRKPFDVILSEPGMALVEEDGISGGFSNGHKNSFPEAIPVRRRIPHRSQRHTGGYPRGLQQKDSAGDSI
jgi:formylglycine-generating enzyme required for sulfatase activity